MQSRESSEPSEPRRPSEPNPHGAAAGSAAAAPLARPALGLECCPGWRGELALLAFFALAALALTWPLALELGRAVGTRGDYLNNIWNAWWLEDSLVRGHTPFWTDSLYFPDGISLRRHTLSPLNSIVLAALDGVGGPHRGFGLLVLAHLALSGWCFSLLARHVTGSTAGAVLAGLVYSFCPFHWFYICQVNVFSFEFLPLALLFFLRHARHGERRDLAGVVLSLAGMAATIEYYVVYCYMAVGVLALCARGWAPEVPAGTRWRRLALAGGLAALAVALVAFPLLSAALGAEAREAEDTTAQAAEMIRFNDLLGFFWIGGPEKSTVSWPTMLGYSTLALLAAGWRRVLAHWPWVVTGLVFLVLSMGRELEVGGRETGVPLPYAVFEHLPVLSMLRKSDRFFMVVQLCACVSLAAAWAGISARVAAPRARAALWCACALLVGLELGAAPLATFEIQTSPGLVALRDDASVTAVMELPPEERHLMNARTNYYQTIHHKKTTLGYTTSIAVLPLHDRRLSEMREAYYRFMTQGDRAFPRLVADLGVDRVVHYKSRLDKRPLETEVDKTTLWKPFCFLRRPLLLVRQRGEFVEVPYPAETWRIIELNLTRALGAPLYEDDFMAVFPAPRS